MSVSYQVVRKLAEGAVAEVFLAKRPDKTGQVVLKVLRPELTSDAAIAGRFLDESRVCEKLDHPNVVKHLGSGRLPDGRVYIVTELLEGEDLGSRLRNQGPLAPDELVRLAIPLCKALQYVHSRGVVHRDIKPDNVFLKDGLPAFTPKLIDFGLALFRDQKTVKTAAGVIVATPEYTPPECINGQKADARSDLYALGVLMHEALTGSPPFAAQSYTELLLKHLNEAPPPLPAHAAHLTGIVHRCLAKDPKARFQSAEEVEKALAATAQPDPMGATIHPASARSSGIMLGGEPHVVGNYQVIKLIGEGAMGRVYLAKHLKLGRQVALKMLRSEHSHNPQLVQRFFQEAQTVNQINHEHIVEISDFIEEQKEDSKRVAIVMELLTGSSLTDRLRSESMPVARIARIVREVASALEAAHRVGVVHRDIKPDNIFITERSGVQDFVKVLDFGVAKLVRPLSDSPTVGTMEGVIIGTPAYMSPEQAAGKKADARVDIYAVGIVLYEMLVGTPPFDGEAFGQLMVKIVTEPPPPIAARSVSGEPIPEGLKALVMKCLAKEPSARPQSMAEVAEALLPFATGAGVAATSPGKPRAGAKRPWVWMAASAAVAVVAGVGGWMYLERTNVFPSAVQAATPPPVATRTTPPEPPKPSRLQLVVHSDPSGAKVTRTDTGEVLGQTPVMVDLAPAKELPLRLELAGYEEIDRKIELVRDKDEDFNMIPKKQVEVRHPGPGKKKEKVTHDGVIDPFAN